jgi:hypothetical protein
VESLSGFQFFERTSYPQEEGGFRSAGELFRLTAALLCFITKGTLTHTDLH